MSTIIIIIICIVLAIFIGLFGLVIIMAQNSRIKEQEEKITGFINWNLATTKEIKRLNEIIRLAEKILKHQEVRQDGKPKNILERERYPFLVLLNEEIIDARKNETKLKNLETELKTNIKVYKSELSNLQKIGEKLKLKGIYNKDFRIEQIIAMIGNNDSIIQTKGAIVKKFEDFKISHDKTIKEKNLVINANIEKIKEVENKLKVCNTVKSKYRNKLIKNNLLKNRKTKKNLIKNKK